MTESLRPPDVFPSACPLDCPDACSLEVRVADGRVVKVDGDHRNPVTGGYICAKVRRVPEHLYGPDRLLHPARRVGPKGEGRFERISWEEALGLAAEKMREARERFGGESILPLCYGGSNGLLTQDTTDARLFHRLGASKLARTVCAAPSGRAAIGLYGKMAGVAYPDFPKAKLIVLWGANPSASGIHLVPYIQEAQKAGAKLVVIDPRRIPLAKKADLHLAPRPGSDLALALAAIHWFFETGRADLAFLAQHATGVEELRKRAEGWTFERAAGVSGVPADEIERFVHLYAESSPALIRTGWGMERNRNGGSAIAAALALPAVAGKFGVRGGGYTMSNSGIWGIDQAPAMAEPPPATRTINMNRMGRTLLEADPPVRVLFVYNCNPLMTLPSQEKVRQGLAREDLFTVVFDQVWTDTARWADLALPATHFLEHSELVRGYGSYVLHQAQPVVQAAGEARSNAEVFAALIERLGLARPGDPSTAEELTSTLLRRFERIRGELDRDGVALPDLGSAPVQFVDAFPQTPDRKIHLVPEALDRESERGLYVFLDDPGAGRLALISPAGSRRLNSTLGQLEKGPAALEIHPEDAGVRGIASGDAVRVWNEHGEVRVAARLNPDLRPGVVYLPKGLWSHNTLSGTTANALAPDTLTDIGKGACFNDARVEIDKIS
ncbi:MAG TPA: molybdopterin-dependent oxidoreductase [Thermoanaerobaculia bacterium]